MSTLGSFGINGRFLTQPMTGVQRYAMNVSRAMSAVLVARGETVPLLSPRDAQDPDLDGLPLLRIGGQGGQRWEQFALPRAWPDALLNFCNTAPVLKKDQVVCIHDANVFVAPESYGFAFRTFYKTLQPVLAKRAARIVTVSRFSATQIAQHLGLKVSDIVVLPNGHEHVRQWDPGQATRARSALRRDPDGVARPFVLALGSRARHKNLRLLLQLAPELAALGIDLVVAGGHAGIYAQEDLQHSDNVQSIGFVTDHDLAFLMEHALCLAFPSLTEGFGLPALEAMALGCPVVSTDRASLPEICGDAALFAPPDQPHRWMAHIRELATNCSLRAELIDRGRAQASLFTWNDTAQGYFDCMRSPKRRPSAPTPTAKPLPNVAVVIATLGRPGIVTQTLQRILDRQTHKPAAVIVSCTAVADAGEAAANPDVTIVTGRPGLAAQRNAALAALPDSIDVVAFFDDDFVPAADWLSIATRQFRDEPDLVGFTGQVIADGIKGPGLQFDEVDRLLNALQAVEPTALIDGYSPYGCNMAFRRSAIGTLRFDERLVLYGWLEDRDFGAALAAKGGRLVQCMEARGVHLGVKSGRVSGDRLGYSQVVNPLYMLRKGTMTFSQVTGQIFRNVVSNLARWPVPESFIDRRGRLRGNVKGAMDALRGRVEPERALQIRHKA
ncbi:glycosyltransferase [Methylobacterium mesophilicum SR1.6/6]|uniref:Glycosyltransferase n=1 Tax=Methylobacterium mesophilicum SR1.6/6 TaxID=908290 RepID=A0A6B9FQP5_9HYPH|nr:glycosyltransferase [Methylobacterium mesophilicum]QGY04189.1 glycosyltransferase [Methylobacterium mesophilicum SR1.6/6]